MLRSVAVSAPPPRARRQVSRSDPTATCQRPSGRDVESEPDAERHPEQARELIDAAALSVYYPTYFGLKGGGPDGRYSAHHISTRGSGSLLRLIDDAARSDTRGRIGSPLIAGVSAHEQNHGKPRRDKPGNDEKSTRTREQPDPPEGRAGIDLGINLQC
jgi:hypothetical protein